MLTLIVSACLGAMAGYQVGKFRERIRRNSEDQELSELLKEAKRTLNETTAEVLAATEKTERMRRELGPVMPGEWTVEEK
jgi:membrane protein YqaA with SNARE-associated domain